MEAINAILRDLVEDYPGYQYDASYWYPAWSSTKSILTATISRTVCERQVSRMPEPINRFARIGARAEDFVQGNFSEFKHSYRAQIVPSSLAFCTSPREVWSLQNPARRMWRFEVARSIRA